MRKLRVHFTPGLSTMVSLFFVTHWGLSVLMQSLFLHRYSAHRMYTMGPRTERALHLLTVVAQF